MAEHVDPVDGKVDDCKETIKKLMETLDDTDVVQAVNESDLTERTEDVARPTTPKKEQQNGNQQTGRRQRPQRCGEGTLPTQGVKSIGRSAIRP